MSGPPKGVAPADLVLKLIERPRPTCDFPFPGKDKFGAPMPSCKLWILTEGELHICRAQASMVAKKTMLGEGQAGDLGYEDIYRNELSVQVVTLAARDPKDIDYQVFISPAQTRDKLTTDEIAAFSEAYVAFRRESGPMISEMSVEEMEAWIRVLQEGGSRLPLSRCSGEMQTDLVMYLVSKLTSLTGNGSSGLPHDGTSPPPSPKATRESDLPVAVPE